MTTVFWVLLLVAVHEAGHAMMARALGYSPQLVFRWNPVPIIAVRLLVPDAGMPARDDVLIASAGPAASVLLGEILIVAGFGLVGGLSIMVGLVSLVPLGPQDGRRIVRALRTA